jgi:hypothetical protein
MKENEADNNSAYTGETGSSCNIFFAKSQKKPIYGRHRYKWDRIKMNDTEIASIFS